MNLQFNDDEEREIYDFIINYHTDTDFLSKVQKDYTENPLSLPILHIYVLEEICKFGKKGIFKKIIESNNDKEISLKNIDHFIKSYNTDINFQTNKDKQLNNNPETLLDYERTILNLIAYYKENQISNHQYYKCKTKEINI